MSRRKKLVFLVATTLALVVLGALGAVLYLQSNPESQFAQFLERHGVPVDAIVNQPQVSAVSQKLEGFIPGMKFRHVDRPNGSDTFTRRVQCITIKGVIGTLSDSTALIKAEGQTHWVKVGEQFR